MFNHLYRVVWRRCHAVHVYIHETVEIVSSVVHIDILQYSRAVYNGRVIQFVVQAVLTAAITELKRFHNEKSKHYD
jgi:hypothetical protein